MILFSKQINVTKKDILEGKPGHKSCPVALALIRTFKLKPNEINVDGYGNIDINFNRPRSDCSISLTISKVSDFVRAFDCLDVEERRKLKPFKFDFTI